MTFETAPDRLAYLEAFGEDANFSLPDMTNWDVKVIFDNAFIDVDGIESRQPVALCRYSDAYNPEGSIGDVDDRVTAVLLSAGGYDVVEFREDGTGMVELVLERQ